MSRRLKSEPGCSSAASTSSLGSSSRRATSSMILSSSRSAFSSRASIVPTVLPPAPNCLPIVMTGMCDQSTSPGRYVEAGELCHGAVAVDDQNAGCLTPCSRTVGAQVRKGKGEVATAGLRQESAQGGAPLVLPRQRPAGPHVDDRQTRCLPHHQRTAVDEHKGIIAAESKNSHRGIQRGDDRPVGN